MVSHQQRYARTESRNLCQREIHEDHFTLDDVETQVNEERRKEKARDKGPFHYLPNNLKVRGHFCAPNPPASVFTMLSIKSK